MKTKLKDKKIYVEVDGKKKTFYSMKTAVEYLFECRRKGLKPILIKN